MHLSRLGLLVHLVASSEWALGMHRHAHGLDPYLGVYGLIAGALLPWAHGAGVHLGRTWPTSLDAAGFGPELPPSLRRASSPRVVGDLRSWRRHRRVHGAFSID